MLETMAKDSNLTILYGGKNMSIWILTMQWPKKTVANVKIQREIAELERSRDGTKLIFQYKTV